MWVRQGRAGEALAWAHERGLSAADDLSYLREFEHVTLLRALLARGPGATPRTTGCGRRRRAAAAPPDRSGSGRADGQRRRAPGAARAGPPGAGGSLLAALVPLERALALAEPEGYVRLFVDEGAPMAALLDAAATRRIAPDVVRQLLTAFSAGPTAGAPVKLVLLEPLSARELDVLQLGAPTWAARTSPARSRFLPEHHAHPHPQHLRQARRKHPAGGRPPGPGPRPALAHTTRPRARRRSRAVAPGRPSRVRSQVHRCGAATLRRPTAPAAGRTRRPVQPTAPRGAA